MLRPWITISKLVTRRIWALTAASNSSIADWACAAARRSCATSLTVAMAVWASLMRPVISERASAWCCATRASQSTMLPSIANSRASNTPMAALKITIATM